MLPYKKSLIPFAKQLRKDMTRQESRLWYDYLRSLPVRFQRQKTIGGYILDFYAAYVGLGVEVDGNQHGTDEAKAYDALRTEELASLDIEIVRFTNQDVDNNFNQVCLAIEQKIADLIREKALR